MNTNVKRATIVNKLKLQVTKRMEKLVPSCGTQTGVTHGQDGCSGMF